MSYENPDDSDRRLIALLVFQILHDEQVYWNERDQSQRWRLQRLAARARNILRRRYGLTNRQSPFAVNRFMWTAGLDSPVYRGLKEKYFPPPPPDVAAELDRALDELLGGVLTRADDVVLVTRDV